MGSINRRKGTILDTEMHQDYFGATVEAPLNNMFGYSTELRSTTQVLIIANICRERVNLQWNTKDICRYQLHYKKSYAKPMPNPIPNRHFYFSS